MSDESDASGERGERGEHEELCLYWLTRPCKQELPPATWVPLIQNMCVDGDLILFTDTGEDAARDERAVAMVHLFESVFTTSRWSWISACDETRGADERAWHTVFYRDTVTVPAWNAAEDALYLLVNRAGEHHMRLYVGARPCDGDALKLLTRLDRSEGSPMRLEEVVGEVGEVGEGEALLAPRACVYSGKELLAVDAAAVVEGEAPSARRPCVRVARRDVGSEASFVRVDVSRSHESSRLADESLCPVRAVLRMARTAPSDRSAFALDVRETLARLPSNASQ